MDIVSNVKIYDFAKRYTKDRKREFVCRLGYFLFFMCPLTDEQIEKIEKLLHDDERYYVQMMEAWLLCEMVVRTPLKGYEVLKRSTLKYNIIGKAIQKCQDSFRIKLYYLSRSLCNCDIHSISSFVIYSFSLSISLEINPAIASTASFSSFPSANTVTLVPLTIFSL